MKIRAYLAIMIGAIILPIALFAAVALHTLLRSEREAALQALDETVSATARLGQFANPKLMQAAAQAQRGLVRFPNRAGIDACHAFIRSPMSGWLIAVSVPAAEIEGAARHAVALAAAGMAVALLCAAFAVAFFGRRLVEAIQGAARAATTLSRGEVPHAARAGACIAEFDALQRSMIEAGQALAASERERAALLEREQGARRMAEDQVRIRDDFLAMLSHELRNPLSGILGAAQLLRMDTAAPAIRRQAQDILVRQGRHPTRIDDLLDLARLARGKVKLDMQPVELASVVESVVEAASVAGRIQHRLHCDLAPAWVEADRTRIEHVVGNLVTNALKYTPAGGSIDIVLEVQQGQACLRVCDSGVGIAPELMATLFDIFVQGAVSLDRSQGGLGIGLSLVRSLVGLHAWRPCSARQGAHQGAVDRG
ncbi:sensor histidine kinase KdpD [Massilia sp. 9096]|uniref:sensor histidine kinase n=1 Tax=Massilia sp. 9096 TaxID=1500894 RepID=UPI00068E0D4B|nr:HAMP domain-containing sensor histidine kinase [Massilia sp. 9096]